jgi:hypothetical protein
MRKNEQQHLLQSDFAANLGIQAAIITQGVIMSTR